MAASTQTGFPCFTRGCDWPKTCWPTTVSFLSQLMIMRSITCASWAMKFLGNQISLLRLSGRKYMHLKTLPNGFLRTMTLFWFLQRIKRTGPPMRFQELKKWRPDIKTLTMIQGGLGKLRTWLLVTLTTLESTPLSRHLVEK